MIKVNLVKTEAADWDYEIDDSSNKVTGSITYNDDFEGWLSRLPALKSAHPTIPALYLKKIKGTRADASIVKVVLSYATNDPAAEVPGKDHEDEARIIRRYAMEPSTGEEPLLTHYLFKDVSDAEKNALLELMASSKTADDFTTALTVVTSVAGLLAVSKIRLGRDAYYNPGLVWSERFISTDLADLELSKILTTTAQPPGGCPAGGATRDWLYLSGPANPLEDGLSWDIEKRWMLSLKGKWDPDFYPAG